MRLLLVHTFPGANAIAGRHYGLYLNGGYDRIVGVTTLGGKCQWPTADTVEIGEDAYIKGPHLCNRLLRTLEFGVAQSASEICVIEYDCVFFRPMPHLPAPGFMLNWTGGEQRALGYKCSRFAHCPWIMDAGTAKQAVEVGDALIEAGEIEGGTPDCFLGLITDRLPKIPVHEGVFKSYSRNSFDLPGHLEESRAAYLAGAHAIHGIKKASELAYITAP